MGDALMTNGRRVPVYEGGPDHEGVCVGFGKHIGVYIGVPQDGGARTRGLAIGKIWMLAIDDDNRQ